MSYLMEELANQRERELAARTRSPLFTQQPAGRPPWPARAARSERGRVRLPRPSRLLLGRWRRRAAEPGPVRRGGPCGAAGAAGLAGAR